MCYFITSRPTYLLENYKTVIKNSVLLQFVYMFPKCANNKPLQIFISIYEVKHINATNSPLL